MSKPKYSKIYWVAWWVITKKKRFISEHSSEKLAMKRMDEIMARKRQWGIPASLEVVEVHGSTTKLGKKLVIIDDSICQGCGGRGRECICND